MNPLWKVFSNFYSKAERAPLLSLPSLPLLPGVKWCRHTLQPQTRLNEEHPEACGKVPGTTSVDQEPTVSCPSLGLRVRTRCQGHIHNILRAGERMGPCLGWELHSSPTRTADICMCAPLSGPRRHVSPLERWISYDIVEVDQNIWARWHYGTFNSSVVVFQHNGIRWLNIRGESYWYSKRHHQQMAY